MGEIGDTTDDVVKVRARPGSAWTLVAAMAVVAAVGTVVSGWDFDPGRAFSEPLMWLTAVGFFAFEFLTIEIPFKKQRHSYSMAEVPTVFGLFYLAPDELIIASLLGMAAEFLLARRQRGLKLLFNLSLQFLMIVMELHIFEAIANSRRPSDVTALIACYVAVVVNALVSHSAVTGVITLVEGGFSKRLFWRGLGLGFATQIANASFGVIGILLIEFDPRALIFLATPIVVMYAAYWAMSKREITELKLQASERRFAALVHASSDVTALVGSDGFLQYVSEAAVGLLGVNTERLVGAPVSELFNVDPEVVARFDNVFAEVLGESTEAAINLSAKRPDGSEVELEVHLTNLLGDPGVEAILLTARDISARKKLEERLVQAQKMDAIGQLAGGIAHDFNNLLAVIQNYASFIRTDLPPGDPSIRDLDEILKATETAASLTQQLLSFARKEIVAPRVVDVNDLVAGMHRMLSRTIKESIELRTALAPDLPRVKIDRGQLEQVIINLAVNAKAAMPDGGSLVISTHETRIRASAATDDLPEGDYVVLSMSDTGVGIPPELRERIFEPFFTTKAKGEGTGLGLATVYGIVKRFGGHIELDSTVGAGTTFRVYLPPTTEAPGESPDGEDNDSSEGRGTILVAEDSDPVRRLVERMLTKASYEVLVAPTGADAFKLWQEHTGEIDLLVTDVIMPQMSGRELSELTGLPTVFISGYTDEIISQEDVGDGGHFLQKPFSATQLLQVVGDAIAASPIRAR